MYSVDTQERAYKLHELRWHTLHRVISVAALFMSVCAGGTQSGPAGTRRHELVIVASLIDKVPNLAGLARTAEVLGVGTLVLSDLRVANDQLFTR
jgi:tRNA G18 (ribose-2'-O)-methylase SpoU